MRIKMQPILILIVLMDWKKRENGAIRIWYYPGTYNGQDPVNVIEMMVSISSFNRICNNINEENSWCSPQ
jgi:hypothetical protein